MIAQHADPGPVPAVVEPASPVERTLVVSTVLGHQVGVTSGDGSGLAWLTLRIRENELTVGLAPHQVDEVCRLLAEACPLELVPAGSAEYTRAGEPGPQGTGRPWPGARFDDEPEAGR